MATYLQGVTDYIPQFQPFQPDLNFYNNVLQTKQTQYDSNYKQLNKVYGQYLYSDLTHGKNIERKEELLKNIDVSLKKVSGLDLSLEQNVTQATQVFKPFYEDQYLMKDMAWTKNYSNQKGRAEGLKNSLDIEQRGMYWDDGVAALDYKREEFKEASLGDTLNIASPSYTNYVNVQEKALKLAKDSDLSIESVDFSPDGKWIVKTKNGQQLEEPLSKLFEASLGSDPAIMEMYKTQSYVNRKNYAYGNAAQFGGDKNAAEMNYLETHFTRLKNEQISRHTELQDASNVYSNKIKDIESQISKGNKDPRLVQTLENLKQNKDINESVLTRVQNDIDLMNDSKSSTATTTTGQSNPYGDVKSLRYKIDNAIASSLMEKDLNQAAHVFAYRNSKQNIEANPYAVLDVKHQYDMQNTALRNQGLVNAAKIRNAGDMQKAMNEGLVKDGSHHWDYDPNSPTYMTAVMNEELQGIKVRASHEGDVTGKYNVRTLSEEITKEKTNTYAVDAVNKMNELVDKYVSMGIMTESQATHIYGSGANKYIKGMNRKQFQTQLDKNATYFLNNQVGEKSLAAITQRFTDYMASNSKVSTVNSDISNWKSYGEKLNQFRAYQNSAKDWAIKATKQVEQGMYYAADDDVKDLVKYMFDAKGNKRSEAEFNKYVPESLKYGKPTPKMLKEWQQEEEELSKIGLSTIGRDKGKITHEWEKGRNIYNELNKLAAKVWTTSKIDAPVAIEAVGVRAAGSGLYTTGINTIGVNHKAHMTPGAQYWKQVKSDLNGVDFGDPGNVQTSFTGATQDGLAGSSDGKNGERGTNSKTQILVQALMQQSENMKSDLKNFTIGSQRIAANNPKKGAIIIYPTKEFLDDYIKGQTEDNPNGTGVITQEDANNMLQNGISIVQNGSNWTNQLYTKGAMTAVESVIDYSGSYQYNDMYGNGNVKIEKANYGGSKYKTTYTHIGFDENGKEIRNTSIGYSNGQADELIEGTQLQFEQLNDYYNSQY